MISQQKISKKKYLELDSFIDEKQCVRFTTRAQAGELAADILGFCPLFKEAYIEAVNANAKQIQMVNIAYADVDFKELVRRMEELPKYRDKPSSEFAAFLQDMPSPRPLSTDFFSITDIPYGKLRSATKAFFFFVRAYHDALYRIALQVITGEKTGRYSAMSKAFVMDEKAGSGIFSSNPVAVHLAVAFPDYCDWFINFRKKRNFIKEGVAVGYSGCDDNLGIALALPDEKGVPALNCAQGITINDWAAALRTSSKLAKIILDEAQEKFAVMRSTTPR